MYHFYNRPVLVSVGVSREFLVLLETMVGLTLRPFNKPLHENKRSLLLFVCLFTYTSFVL